MIDRVILAALVLYSGHASASEFSVTLNAYVSCLETSYYARIGTSTDSKQAVSSATFDNCLPERTQFIAIRPLRDADPILIRIEDIARTEMTK